MVPKKVGLRKEQAKFEKENVEEVDGTQFNQKSSVQTVSESRGISTSVTDGRTEGRTDKPTDGQTDRQTEYLVSNIN